MQDFSLDISDLVTGSHIGLMLKIGSPNIVRVIESRRLRWARHVAGMEKDSRDFKILIGKSTVDNLGIL